MVQLLQFKWVIKRNDYIEAVFTNYKPTLAQNRIVLWLASQVHSKKDVDFKLAEISGSDLMRLMGHKVTRKQMLQQLVILKSATATSEGNQPKKVETTAIGKA